MSNELKRPLILISIMLGMFLSAIEATIVATAMPDIVADLRNFSLYSWVFSSYLLSSSATVLLFGKLADSYGRRPIYVIGICIFLIGSVVAGFSNTMHLLIVARFLQGIGAGAIMPIATTIVGDIYTTSERAKIQGYLSAVWGISAISGPLIGAFFVDYLNWRFVFWMNIPLGIISMLGIIVFLKEKTIKGKQSVDYIGAIVMMIGISLLMLVLVEGGITIAWNSWTMGLLMLVIIVSIMLFIKHERRMSQPLMPSVIWKYKLLKIANIASLVTGMIMISVSSYLPTFVQGIMGKSAIVAGFTLTSMSIGWPIASTVAGRLLLKIGYRKTSLLGGIGLLIGTSIFITLPTIQHFMWAGIGSFFIGIGMGMTSTSFIVAIQSSVEWKIRGIATAMNMFMRTIGSALGVALLGGILNNQINRKIEAADLQSKVSIDQVDSLLKKEELTTLTKEAVNVLQNGLLSGLQYVYVGIGLLSVITFIIILSIPKNTQKEKV